MSEIGKRIRLERILNRDSHKILIVPMDHGVTVGPIKGIINVAEMVNKVAEGGATAVLLHKGIVQAGHRGYGRDIGLIIHVSASTALGSDPNYKIQATSIKEAIKLGADAVSIHVNVGANDEPEMLRTLGSVAEQCAEWGMPLLAMMYPRGPKVKSEHAVEFVKHAARVGAELGADIIKTNYTGSVESFKEVVDGSPVPVVIAGGPKMANDLELLTTVKGAIDAGAKGVAFGRNIFQHSNPTLITKAIGMIVHENADVEEATKILSKH